MVDLKRDTAHLANSQYKTAENVEARWSLYDNCVPPIDFHQFSLDALELKGTENILELGCAAGGVLLSLREERQHSGRLVGLEVNSTIMQPAVDRLRKHPDITPIKFVVGSADTLPFEDSSFDVLLGFFMLYHMPDIPGTLKEWRRVLRPEGRVLVSTGSRHNRPRGKLLKQEMARLAGVQPHEKFSASFDMENGRAQLEEVFTVVDEYIYHGEFQVTDINVLMKAVESDRDMYSPSPSVKQWATAMDYAKHLFEDDIKTKGSFTDTVERGYFICR